MFSLCPRCTAHQAYRMPSMALVNLSHGERKVTQNSQKPTAVVKPQANQVPTEAWGPSPQRHNECPPPPLLPNFPPRVNPHQPPPPLLMQPRSLGAHYNECPPPQVYHNNHGQRRSNQGHGPPQGSGGRGESGGKHWKTNNRGAPPPQPVVRCLTMLYLSAYKDHIINCKSKYM